MTSRVNLDLCSFQLVGDTIKLSERPSSSSHSSNSKRYYTHISKLSSRPSSALPRLCPGDNMQDDLSSIKNSRRPYSADYEIPNLLSGKSKDTLSDGSLESIYVPIDFQLPSSNLFKELLEQDIEEWRHSSVKFPRNVEISHQEEIVTTIATCMAANEDGEKRESDSESKKNGDKSKESMLDNDKNVMKTTYTNVYSSPSTESVLNKTNEHHPTREGDMGDKCVLTPGLTAKPPIPRRLNHLPISAVPLESNSNNDNAIYDYFAIKYNMESNSLNSFTRVAEKPICEEIPEEIENEIGRNEEHMNTFENDEQEEDRDIVIQHISNSEGKQEDTNTQCIKTVEVFEEQRDENDFDLNLTVNNWLEELNLKTVQQKELETDKYIKEVRQRCGNSETATVSSRDLPSLSEIDIDDLFKLEIDENIEEQHDKSDIQTISPSSSPPPRSNKLLCKESNEKVFRKATKPKSPARKPPSNKFHTEKSVENNKTVRSNKTFSKAKFIAMPIKLKKTCESPRKNADLVEDSIETWIGKQEMHPRGKKAVFTDLIDRVDDLRSTTEIICKDIPVDAAPTPEENKQENFDDLETLIEALEHQDKTSQNSIKTMKKIVTSELSNSIILNENEENMSFKRRNDKIEDNPNAEITSVTSEGMNQKTTSGLTSPSESQGSRNEDNNSVCKHFKNVQKQELLEESKQAQNDVKVDMCGGDHSRTRPCNGHHNYKELLSYLDEVDKKCTKTLEVAKERAQTASKLVLESSNLFETMPKVEDLLTHTPGELASFIIDLSLRVKDKTSCIALLQNELASLRDKVLTQSKQAEAMLRHKLKEKKEETERIAKRHQKFIDQLMEEKKTMARKCEELVEEMTAMEDKYVSNMKAVEHKHQVEIQKMKDMNAASEKLRRERWIEGRTQKIKEMAVKSIEPEVERMEKRHQEELSNLRALHKREIEEMELRAARKLQEHSESVREQLIQDREKALAHERDVMRLRYEKLVESEERSYQEQRRRLLADHANRVAECEEREAQVVAEKERAIKQAQDEFEEKLQAAARRHANEMKLVKETTVMEMENWKNSFRKQQSALLMEKETSIRRECRKERDREIELVIERLENEANKARTQMEQTTENRIKRIREKYEAEMRDLEMLEKDAQNKYCEARSKLLEYEDVILTLRTSIRQLETQLTEEKLKRSKLEAEREEIRQAIRKEYEDKMQSLENEVEELRTSGDKQVEQLYSRVRVSLARKDELLAELSNDYKALKEKCVYLENMIEQQRKEFMINN